MGLATALALLAGLLFTNIFRSMPKISRWRDIQWLAWLAVPVYLLHQFDEYGFFYAHAGMKTVFADTICLNLGYDAYPECPLPLTHFSLVNIALSWLLIPLAAHCYRYSRTVGLVPWGAIFVNGLTHTAALIGNGMPPFSAQNAGASTSLLLFLPLSSWVAHVCLRNDAIHDRSLWIVAGVGVFSHLLLFAAFASFRAGGAPVMFALDIAALALPLPAAWLAERIFVKPAST